MSRGWALTTALLVTSVLGLSHIQGELNECCIDPNKGFKEYLRLCQGRISWGTPTNSMEYEHRQRLFWNTCSRIFRSKAEGVEYVEGVSCHAHIALRELVPRTIEFPNNERPAQLPSEERKVSSGWFVSSTTVGYTNWREQGKVSAVKNQETCGSCWSFATIAAMESAFKRMNGDEHDLSEQHVIKCIDVYNTSNSPTSDCLGGIIDYALNLEIGWGTAHQSDYPYASAAYGTVAGTPNTVSDCFSSNVSYERLSYPQNSSRGQWFRYDNVTHTQIANLLDNGTLVVAFYVESGFYSYQSGVYSCPVDFETAYRAINHAVELVGMTGEGDYVVKNSWGDTWGDGGYATISKSADCGVSAHVYAVKWGSGLGVAVLGLIVLLVSVA